MKIRTLTLFSWLVASFFQTLSAQEFDVYVSDAGNFSNPPWQILKFDQNGENGVVFISDHLSWPQDIFFLENENAVLISNLNTNVISKFDANTGTFLGEFATGIEGPTRMALGPDSLLYVLQWLGNGKVKRYQLDGTFVDDFTETGVGNSIGLDWDAEGNLYVSSYNGNYVKKFGLNGEDLDNFISSGLNGPTNIWFDSSGVLFVNNWNNGLVKRYDSMGNPLGNFISGVPQVEGIDYFPNGNLALGVGSAAVVKVYGPNGTFIKNLFPPGTLDLLRPNAVVFRERMASSTKERFLETTFVTPSVGSQFNIAFSFATSMPATCEVFDTSGMMVGKIDLSTNTVWDASGLATGIYYLRAKLPDGTWARQKVVVQR